MLYSRAGGNTELVGESQERGYLFPYNDKEKINYVSNYVINYVNEAREKSKKAREFVAGFNEEMMIEKLEQSLKTYNPQLVKV